MKSLLFVDPKNFESIIARFKEFPVEENIHGEKNGDRLFGEFQVGNNIVDIVQPFERFHDYERLIFELHQIDSTKYFNLHKGTAFYFLAWLAFDLKSYNKALFYIDAAVAEDIKHQPHWEYGSAVQFYFLEKDDPLSQRTVKKIKAAIQCHLDRFASITGTQITLADFVDKFVKPLVRDNNRVKRSLVSALYIFLLEFNDLYETLLVRTSHGGSILPYVDHLFNGGLIFESLLKEFYPGTGNTMDKILNSRIFKTEFSSAQIKSSANTLNAIVDAALGTNFETAFTVVSKLRNTTGHQVIWDDVFKNPENFRLLFENEINASLYLIAKKKLFI